MLLEYTNCGIVKLVLTLRNCILEYQYICYGALTTQKENLNATSVQAVIKLIRIQKGECPFEEKYMWLKKNSWQTLIKKCKIFMNIFFMYLQFGINVFTCGDLNPGLFQNNLCKSKNNSGVIFWNYGWKCSLFWQWTTSTHCLYTDLIDKKTNHF